MCDKHASKRFYLNLFGFIIMITKYNVSSLSDNWDVIDLLTITIMLVIKNQCVKTKMYKNNIRRQNKNYNFQLIKNHFNQSTDKCLIIITEYCIR